MNYYEKEKISMEVDDNAYETLHYSFSDFPVFSMQEKLSSYPERKALCHWHEDFELLYVVEGEMNYFVDGITYLLKQNTGIFVNSARLHYGYSNGVTDCLFQTFIFPPTLLSTNEAITSKYIEPFMHEFDCMLLSPLILWQDKVLDILKSFYSICHQKKFGFELIVQNQILTMWSTIFQNKETADISHSLVSNVTQELKEMLQFIQINFTESITLQEIADSGTMCRSKCCKLFASYLKTTPFAYLNHYRLEKSCYLLNNSTQSVTEIALACGFKNPSYFTEYFHREIGKTPSEYRN